MGQFLVALLWLAVLCSLGVYAYRIWRRVTKGPKNVRDANGLTAQPPPDAPSPTAELFRSAPPAPAPTALPPETTTPPPAPAAPPPPEPAAPPVAPSPPATEAPAPPARRGPTFVPAPDANPTPTPTSTPTDGVVRAGLFAPRTAGPSGTDAGPTGVASEPAAPRPTVAEALAGIAMPCGLAPLIDPDAGLDPHRVAFSTTGLEAAEVGARVGDELERLGFSVRSVSETGVDATRGTILVHVALHPDAATEMIGSAMAYPTVPPGTVVVEFST